MVGKGFLRPSTPCGSTGLELLGPGSDPRDEVLQRVRELGILEVALVQSVQEHDLAEIAIHGQDRGARIATEQVARQQLLVDRLAATGRKNADRTMQEYGPGLRRRGLDVDADAAVEDEAAAARLVQLQRKARLPAELLQNLFDTLPALLRRITSSGDGGWSMAQRPVVLFETDRGRDPTALRNFRGIEGCLVAVGRFEPPTSGL
jgi:hypothetical protein